MTLISVILPFKNAYAFIERAINSILDQTFEDFELVLIDDNSEDNSRQLIENIKDKRLRLIKNTRSGLVSALHTGIAHASGEFIARMDADDLAMPDRLEKQLEHLRKKPENYVSSCRVKYKNIVDDGFSSSGYQLYVDWLNKLITPQDHYINRFVDAPVAHPTLFCRKSVFENYGTYLDEDHPEDFELWLRWMANGVKFEKLEDVLLEWTDHEERLSRVHKNYDREKFFQLKAKYFSREWSKIKAQNLWIIGYGKEVIKRSAYLSDFNLKIAGYVDVSPRPAAQRRVISYADIDSGASNFYLVYVSDRLGKKLIKNFFDQHGMLPAIDYLFMV